MHRFCIKGKTSPKTVVSHSVWMVQEWCLNVVFLLRVFSSLCHRVNIWRDASRRRETFTETRGLQCLEGQLCWKDRREIQTPIDFNTDTDTHARLNTQNFFASYWCEPSLKTRLPVNRGTIIWHSSLSGGEIAQLISLFWEWKCKKC